MAGLLVAVMSAASAFAQNVTTLSIVSGNGQMICSMCAGYAFQMYEPLKVKALDASGKPVVGVTITWSVVTGQLLLPGTTSTTGADGIASITPFVQINLGAASLLQGQIRASIGTVGTTFTLTQAFPVFGAYPSVQVTQVAIGGTPIYQMQTISGQSGTQYAGALTLHVDGSGYLVGNSIPSVSVRLISTDANPTSTVSCMTGTGADPGSVLTDANGNATCTIVFGGTAGQAHYAIQIGGVAQSAAGTGPIGFWTSAPYTANITAATPSMIQILSGNGQSSNPGTVLPAPLVAKVTDSLGNPISGQTVSFVVTPAAAGSVSGIQNVSDAAGQVFANLAFSSSAVGSVTVTVALVGNSSVSATFTETANVLLSGLQKNSGDSQSAVVSTQFAQPLVVTVNGSNGQSLANYPVQFSVTSGSATLSANSVSTGSDGRAQVTVTAGATTGAVVVTASAGSYSQTFNLTVTPAGPNVTAGSFYNAAGFQQGSLSPCSIAAIIATGIAPGIQGSVGPVIFGPMSREIALGAAGTKVSVSFAGTLAPIYSASNINGQEQLNVQVPCEVVPSASVAVTVNVGGATKTVNIAVQPASPGIFTTTAGMTDNVSRAAVLRPDGSWVSLANAARKGETLRLYATGVGATLPAATTGNLPAPGADDVVQGTVIVGYGTSSGGAGGAKFISARLLPDEVGVYEVAFQLPADSATGNNVNLSMGVIPVGSGVVYFSNTVKLPVQ